MTLVRDMKDVEAALAEAERCSREAKSLVKDEGRYSGLIGKPSAWCVVTEKGLWSRAFHTELEKDRLTECIEKGHRVILTVGGDQPGATDFRSILEDLRSKCIMYWNRQPGIVSKDTAADRARFACPYN
jgi:hypothetical protein